MIERIPPDVASSDGAIGVLTVDQSLTVRTWSAWLEAVSGIRASDSRGRRLPEVLPDLERRGLLGRFSRVLETGEAQVLAPAFHHYLIPCAPRSPSAHFQFMQQHVTLGPLREGDRVAGVMATIEDVTAQLDADRTLSAELQSADPAVRERAAKLVEAAGGDARSGAMPRLLRHDSWQVRRGAVQGFARRASAGLVASLIDALRDEHREFNVLSSALQLLSVIDVDVTAPLAELLQAPDPDLRIQAALALGEQASPAAVPALLGALEDPDPNVRFHAIESLGRLRSSEAVDSLAALAESRDFFLAFPAIDALARIDDPRVAPRLVPLLDDDALCAPVAEALGRLGNGDMTGALVAVLDHRRPPVAAIALAIATLHASYEKRYGGGAYITSEFQAALTATGAQRVLDALRDARQEELRALVLLLGWMRSPAVGRALTQLLGHPDVRADVLEALVRHGAAVVDLLIDQLGGEDDEVRLAAVVALGRLGDLRATEPLTQLLLKDRGLAIAAAESLASIGDPRAFEPLLALIGHPDATVRQAITAALNSLGHPDMPSRIARLLHDGDARTRESAVRIAGYFGYPECADAVLERCQDEDEAVRRAALEHAPFSSESRALPVLLRAMARDTPRARAAAASALGQILLPESRQALVGALADGDPWVRYFAARALGRHRHADALAPLGAVAAGDQAPHVRIAALEAIGVIDGSRAVELLSPHVEDTDTAIAAAALASLGRVTDDGALVTIHRALRSADPARRHASVTALSARGGPASVASLRWAAEADASTEVRQAALDGISRLAGLPNDGWEDAVDALVDLMSDGKHRDGVLDVLAHLPPTRVDRVVRGLAHPAAKVRRATIEALTRMKRPEASACVRASLDHEDASVREAAVIALDRIGARGVFRKLSAMAATDTDAAVRRAAAAALFRQPDPEGDGGAGG